MTSPQDAGNQPEKTERIYIAAWLKGGHLKFPLI